MAVQAQVMKPGEIEVKITAVFTLNQWKRILDNLDDKYIHPMSDLADGIRNCIHQAEQTFHPKKSKS